MRVLHVGKFYPPYMGGMETHLQALGGELRKRLDVQVIVANPGRRSVRETVDGVPVSRVGTAFTVASAQICPGMSRQIRAADADIVHLHHPNPTATFSLLASGYRGRVIVTYHSDIVRQKLLGAAFRPVLRRLLGRSAAIIVTSPNYLATSPELAPFRDRCHVIPYGISVGRFGERDETAIARIRREHGPRILLAVGRMIYYKGFEYLVRAMRDVDARLLLVGMARSGRVSNRKPPPSASRTASPSSVRSRMTRSRPTTTRPTCSSFPQSLGARRSASSKSRRWHLARRWSTRRSTRASHLSRSMG